MDRAERVAVCRRVLDGETGTVSVRRRVAAHLGLEPLTTPEVAQRVSDVGRNTVRPRMLELVRMGCVRRSGTRPTESGRSATVHHLTALGVEYVRGVADPSVEPPLATYRRRVVDRARAVARGEATVQALGAAVHRYDAVRDHRSAETTTETESETAMPTNDKETWQQRKSFEDKSIDVKPWQGLAVEHQNTAKHEFVKWALSRAVYQCDRPWDSEVRFPNGREADVVDLGPEDEKAVVYEVETGVTPSRASEKLEHFYYEFENIVRDVIIVDPADVPDDPAAAVAYLLDEVVVG